MIHEQKSNHPPCRILLADDNHHGNAARKSVLEEEGFTVECALSGEEALKLHLEEPFDLIVTDLKMKRMSGLDLIARLREEEHPPLIILLSGFAACLGLTEESSGADAVLAKSNKEQDQLIRTVKQLLARKVRRKMPGSVTIAKSHVARSG
jgi:CheY-like chemotaxis protein